MTFREWIIETKLRSKLAVGDLAKDIFFDEAAKSVPNTREEGRAHLKHSPTSVHEVLAQA
ncbi:MAG: hypothetical protein WBR10_19265 [Candidatus Acidiferrum sp.]